jgi:hypothetical protein
VSPRAGPAADPLSGVELVLVDGNNLLGSSRLPAGAVIGPIRAAIPAGVRVELVFDGPPRGVTGRLATAFSVRYSGRTSADSVILDVVTRQAREHGPAGTWSILVVSDDRALREAARMAGARSAGTVWLAGRMDSLAHPRAREAAGRSGSRRTGHGRTETARPGRAASSTTGPRPGPMPVPRPRNGTSIGNGRPPRRPNDEPC